MGLITTYTSGDDMRAPLSVAPHTTLQADAPGAALSVRSATSATTKRTASVPTKRARLGRAMTNAERGRAFRERRIKYTGELEVELYRLRAHIAELESVRDLWRNAQLYSRKTSDSGSLVRLVHEYMTLFRFGFRFAVAKAALSTSAQKQRPSLVSPDVVQAKISYQEHFLRRVMAHDARVGESVGPEASISNWNGYTLAHGNDGRY